MEKENGIFNRTQNKLLAEIAFMKWRMLGMVIIVIALIIALTISFMREEKITLIDKSGDFYSSEKVLRTNSKILFIEAQAHAERFYGTFWTFDNTNYKEQINKAGYLGGAAIKEIHKALMVKEYYDEIQRKGYYVNSVIDSVDKKKFSFSNGVVNITIYGRTLLTNVEIIEVRRLDMQLSLVIVERRLGVNPNGFSIERINILSNDLVSQTKNSNY